ncbi:MAG: hypothetical protein QOD33_1856 [Pyrinomonadaceae bacterium]|jgi:hypothetical protein|nr:hypothetical protein [Pyrinomonadaceae bacterium]
MSLFLCIAAFFACVIAGRRSLVSGLVVLMGIGYGYGIIRANLPDPYSHFIFDAGVVGIYLTQLFRPLTREQRLRTQGLRPWLEFLMAWPLLLFLIPNQDFLIRVVGLRGNIFLLLFLLIGARIVDADRYNLSLWLAVLNIAVCGFALLEFFTSVERFFPRNEVTRLIYSSKDLVGYTAYRIPATFSGSHAYAGTMVMCLPFLFGALQQKNKQSWQTPLLVAGLIASLGGVLLAATKLHFVGAAATVLVAVFSTRSRSSQFLGWLLVLLALGWVISGDERLQRFTQLQDTEMVSERVGISVNQNFLNLAASYPFGNGLGGGGTSMPYFLQSQIQNPVGIENEYARIMLEQGLIGLFLWLAFITWVLAQPGDGKNSPWHVGRRLAWVTCAAYFASGLLGTGLFTSIPQTCLFLMNVGWVAARQTEPVREAARLPQITEQGAVTT